MIKIWVISKRKNHHKGGFPPLKHFKMFRSKPSADDPYFTDVHRTYNLYQYDVLTDEDNFSGPSNFKTAVPGSAVTLSDIHLPPSKEAELEEQEQEKDDF